MGTPHNGLGIGKVKRDSVHISNDRLCLQVIFDEVHYVNDTERGVVWEEVRHPHQPRSS